MLAGNPLPDPEPHLCGHRVPAFKGPMQLLPRQGGVSPKNVHLRRCCEKTLFPQKLKVASPCRSCCEWEPDGDTESSVHPGVWEPRTELARRLRCQPPSVSLWGGASRAAPPSHSLGRHLHPPHHLPPGFGSQRLYLGGHQLSAHDRGDARPVRGHPAVSGRISGQLAGILGSRGDRVSEMPMVCGTAVLVFPADSFGCSPACTREVLPGEKGGRLVGR